MSKVLEFWHHHGGVSVPDLDAAIAWWHDVLGFEVARRFPIVPGPWSEIPASGTAHARH